jgi:hypothetical protein
MGGLDAVKLSQARGQVAKMSAADQKLFETGFVSNLLAKIESRQDGQDVVKAVFNSPFARKQAEIALGSERAGLLEARLQTEQAPVPALQSMGIGRAEDDQPQVSGP